MIMEQFDAVAGPRRLNLTYFLKKKMCSFTLK